MSTPIIGKEFFLSELTFHKKNISGKADLQFVMPENKP
jgi:hypothetical protein